MQPQGHVQVIVNMKDFGTNLQEAVDASRVNHVRSSQPFGSPGKMADGGIVYIENGFSEVVRSEFIGMGHQIDLISGRGLFGGVPGDPSGSGDRCLYGGIRKQERWPGIRVLSEHSNLNVEE